MVKKLVKSYYHMQQYLFNSVAIKPQPINSYVYDAQHQICLPYKPYVLWLTIMLKFYP